MAIYFIWMSDSPCRLDVFKVIVFSFFLFKNLMESQNLNKRKCTCTCNVLHMFCTWNVLHVQCFAHEMFCKEEISWEETIVIMLHAMKKSFLEMNNITKETKSCVYCFFCTFLATFCVLCIVAFLQGIMGKNL